MGVVGMDTVVKTVEANVQLGVSNELLLQVNQMIEKNEGGWRCKVCGKMMTIKCNIQQHAESHIEGMSFSCHLCNKAFPSRSGLRLHISNIHSELFSCDICGKSGMNRGSYYDHKSKKHRTLSVNH